MDIDREIREFLMSRRARITPEQAGLPFVGGRRRVPGLRREEVAMLAGVSVEYYTRLERGRLGGASESVLDSVAQVLELDDDERSHLYALARNAVASKRRSGHRTRTTAIDPTVQHILDSMSVPAFVQNATLDVLAANELGRALYPGLFAMAGSPPNLARFAFLDSGAKSFYADIDSARDLTVAILHATAGRDPLDHAVTDLIGELAARSPDFGVHWAKHNVRRHMRGRKVLNHPVVGFLELEYNDLALPGDPSTVITTYTATPGSSTADGLAVLGTWAQTEKTIAAARRMSSS
ncbi:helix-turn-helix transcriptional regulator [Gordonia sp. NPDC127522]|uniref:helix-turn-helix transcriptional regulator n=1 Tax=Gordonia sp. NPDC127522 TaxID=3345390 RepID=UPI00363AF7AE